MKVKICGLVSIFVVSIVFLLFHKQYKIFRSCQKRIYSDSRETNVSKNRSYVDRGDIFYRYNQSMGRFFSELDGERQKLLSKIKAQESSDIIKFYLMATH